MTATAPRRLLTIFCVINLLVYVTRYLTAATLPEVGRTFAAVSKQGLGYLATAFVVAYLMASPVFGVLGDRRNRLRLMGIGLLLAAGATSMVFWVSRYFQLAIARAVMGIGQSAFVAIAPAVLADVFTQRRASVLGLFNMGIPVGTALSYVLAGVFLAFGVGWQTIFGAVGLPTLLIGLLIFWMPDPPRTGEAPVSGESSGGIGRYLQLLRNRSLMINILAGSANSFAMGGLAYWMPSYLHSERKLSVAHADMAFGMITAAAGALGSIGGGYLGDHLLGRTKKAYGLVAGSSALAAVPLFYLFFGLQTSIWMWVVMGVAEVLLFIPSSPALSLTMDVTKPRMRATANALSIVFVHLLGESISPVLIGALADSSNMTAGLSAAAIAIGVSGILWLLTTPFLAADIARAEAVADF